MARQFRIGHTGITWPRGENSVATAVRDIAELGYYGFETFGHTIVQYNEEHPEGFGALLKRHDIPLGSAYCALRPTDPSEFAAGVAEIMEWAALARDLGASTIVLQGGRRSDEPYAHFDALADVFSDIGRRVAELGLIAAIHPHTGTLIETGEEIDAVMNAIDRDIVFFAPDTGQIQKGGSDAVAVLRNYKELIRHVHLKDYVGGPVEYDEEGAYIDPTGYAGYLPIGEGVIDMPALFALLEEIDFQDWIMVELDGRPTSPYPPREAAAMSKRYLAQALGQRFRT